MNLRDAGTSFSPESVNRLAGSSEVVRQLEVEIECAGRCDAKVLITGESGVGKEVVARQIHLYSNRRHAPIVAINCAGIPDSLLESELFGHQRGSFTGAYRDKLGLLELAHHGTLFMDEVCEMSLRMQAVLLRFLETGEIQRVGADLVHGRVDVRVIAATNRDIEERVAAGEFRADLFYRLNVIQLRVPPLRERPEDILPLVDDFLAHYSRERGTAVPSLTPEVQDRLEQYLWPGNVRELRNVVERMVLRLNGPVVKLEDLPPQFSKPARKPAADAAPPEPAVASVLFDRMVNQGECFWSVVYEPLMARDLTRADVRETIRLGLIQTEGSYQSLILLFNIQASEYKRFLTFLRTYKCNQAYNDLPALPHQAPAQGVAARTRPM